jgi:hypothetical protein
VHPSAFQQVVQPTPTPFKLQDLRLLL